MLILKILGGVAALALGLWLGLPGRYDRRYDEIERALDGPGGRSKKVKRHFTPLAWVQRKIEVSSGGGSRQQARRGFKLDRPGEEGRPAGGGAFNLKRPGEDDASDERPDVPFRLRRPGDG